ncbi:hypothetical protein [Thiomicrorhabdus cannonii]|uniref:RraA family protein n=1 Tax=Thiomicrorhabdus cannonii TaxID=2748011 RepID=UPI0015BAE638|nr:hypothetical protein [Thiomicrorhabdus cannonii]
MIFGTAEICDTYHGNIQVVSPLFKSYGGSTSISADIETLKTGSADEVEEVLKNDGKKRVLFIDSGQRYVSVVDRKIADLAIRNNWRGLVVNGYVRNAQFLKGLPLAIWGLGTCPIRESSASETLQSCDLAFTGLTVMPGMHLYADDDGMIITDGAAVVSDSAFNVWLDYSGI